MSHRWFRNVFLWLGGRRSFAPLLGSHQANNLHCVDHSRCRQTRCREQPSHFSSRHNSHHQQVCLHTSSSTRSVPRSDINHVVFFRACSLAVTSLSFSFRHSCWPYLICNHIHSVPVVPIFVNDVEILVTCRPWLHSTCHHCAELHTFFFNLALTFVLRVFKFCHLTSRRVPRTPDFLVPSCVALHASSNSVLPDSCNDFHILLAFTVTSVISWSVGKSILNSCCFSVKCWLLSSPASLFNATLFLEASDTQINTRSN